LYTGKDIRIHTLPALLFGDQWVRTSLSPAKPVNDTAMALISIGKAADIYVAFDKSIQTLPEWLHSYTKAEDSLVSDANGVSVFKIYKRSFEEGAWVRLGENGQNATGNAQMYTAIIHYPTAFEKAEKVKRPTVTYPAGKATLKGGARETTIEGATDKSYMALRHVSDTTTWTMNVGVGDTYELRFRYRTGSDKQVPVWLTVKLSDGTLMRHDKIFFAPADTKWKTLYSSTGTNINAGTYTVQLVPAAEGELLLDKLDVQ